jgi:hypothetical protein
MPPKLDDYTGVSEHDARHLQQEYLATLAEFQRLVIEAIKALLKLTQNNKPNPDRPVENEIYLMDNNEVVAGWVNQTYVDKTTEQFWKELGQVLATPAGENAPDAGAKQITLNGKVILQSDAEGNVLVNEVLDNPELRKQLGLNIPGIIALMELYEQQRKQQTNPGEEWEENQDSEGYVEPDTQEASFVDYWNSEFDDDSFMYEPDIYDIPFSEQEDFFNTSDFQLSAENFNQNKPQTITTPIPPQIDTQARLDNFRNALNNGDFEQMRASVADLSKSEKVAIFQQLNESEKVNAFELSLTNNLNNQAVSPIQNLDSQIQFLNTPQSAALNLDKVGQPSTKIHDNKQKISKHGRVFLEKCAVPSTNDVVQILGSSKQGTAHFLEGCSGCPTLSTENPPPVNTNNQFNNLVRENIFDKLNRVWKTFQESLEENFGKQPINREANPLLISEQAQNIREERAFIKDIYSMVENHRRENDDLSESISLTTEKYTINNYKNHYEVENSAGERILSFDNTLTGLKLESSNLSDSARADFVDLSNSLKMGKQSQAFLSVGASETEAMVRSINIANSLTDIAQQSNSNIKVDGANFNYKWTSKPNGEVNIWKKSGEADELILSRSSKGEMQFNMQEKDMKHFENAAQSLQAMAVKPQTKMSGR